MRVASEDRCTSLVRLRQQEDRRMDDKIQVVNVRAGEVV
jgi:hypothetical protein